MLLTSDQLSDDMAALKALVVTKDAALMAGMAALQTMTASLQATTAELAAARNGLVVTQLTIEKLKAQIARLKREKFGASSEKIERAIEQLELALEEAEAAKAEAIAAAPQPPEPETPAPDSAAASAEPPKRKRRQFSADLSRRDVVHAPAGVCKACGGDALRTVGESVTEVLAYVPARFEVIRHVRPACSCRTCETMVQAPMPELPIPCHGEAMLRMDAWSMRASSRT